MRGESYTGTRSRATRRFAYLISNTVSLNQFQGVAFGWSGAFVMLGAIAKHFVVLTPSNGRKKPLTKRKHSTALANPLCLPS